MPLSEYLDLKACGLVLRQSLYAAVFIVRMRPSMFELEAMYNWEITQRSAEAA